MDFREVLRINRQLCGSPRQLCWSSSTSENKKEFHLKHLHAPRPVGGLSQLDLLKNMFYCPLLVLKGIYHHGTFIFFFPGGFKQMEDCIMCAGCACFSLCVPLKFGMETSARCRRNHLGNLVGQEANAGLLKRYTSPI